MKCIAYIHILLIFIVFVACSDKSLNQDYPIQPVLFTDVEMDDDFWTPRMDINRTVTIPIALKHCETTGRIDNFAKAGGILHGEHIGRRYNDSDVFKVIEGASYSLHLDPNQELDAYLDGLIGKITAAQETDGYLYTVRSIDLELKTKTDREINAIGRTRWENLEHSHELYNVGHLYEAAVAHFQATGRLSLLDVAIKNADLIVSEFGPGKRSDVPGHEEIEIGLVKLYRVTRNPRYLDLAEFFINQRGDSTSRETLYGTYAQDHIRVINQTEPVGHAVRAMYLYAGMTDVAAIKKNKSYVKTLDRIWDNLVKTKMYVTGGIGSTKDGEAFGQAYNLPNRSAYCETCAAVGHALWNHRMFLLHGESKYLDILERILYNGFLSGVSISGDRFFYVNPLQDVAESERQPWFGTACCPSNVCRFMPSIAGYIYAKQQQNIYINLFIGSKADIQIKNQMVHIIQKTKYPWDGKIKINIKPQHTARFAVYIRMPGWSQNQPVPGDLYKFADTFKDEIRLWINNKHVDIKTESGFIVINRTWKTGDCIDLELPMPVRRVIAHDNVAENAGKVAIQRGPVMYCAEGVDNKGHVINSQLPAETKFSTEYMPDILNGIVQVKAKINDHQDLTMVPYYAWAHRNKGEMAVWIKQSGEL